MRLRKQQQGLTAIGWIITILVAGVIVMGGVRLIPVYIQAQTIDSIMRSVTSEVDYRETREVNRALRRQMQVNDVRAIDVDYFEIEEIDGRYYLTVSYEHRAPFLANIDFMVKFEKQHSFRRQ